MADIEIERQHNMDLATARTKAKQWLDYAREEYGLDVDYVEGTTQDTASISRSGVDANAVLDGQKIRFEAELGFAARLLKGKIKQELENGLDEFFV